MGKEDEFSLRPIEQATRDAGIESPADLEDATDLLARFMDLRGSVSLEEFVRDAGPTPEASPAHPESIRALVTKTVEDVRSRLDFAIENAYRPRFRLPDSDRAWTILQRSKVLDTFQAGPQKAKNKALRSGTRLIWAPFGEFIETRLKRSRFALRDLRDELIGPLTGLGMEVSRIERMDHALRIATENEASKLYQRIGYWAEQRFASALRTALSELPDIADKEAFTMGFQEAGWLGGVFGQAMNLVKGVTEHEIKQLENLIETALDAYETR